MKFYKRECLAIAALLGLSLAFVPQPFRSNAQDLVTTEQITGGSSCFVFRGSRNKAQGRTMRASMSANGRAAISGRSNSQVAAVAAKRRAAAIARRNAMVAANRKAIMSKTLTLKAEGMLDNGQTDQAIAVFRDARVQDPKNKRAAEGLSIALTSKGIDVAGDDNNIAAAPYFQEAAKVDPKNDVAFAKLGALYDASGDNAKAIANYQAALALNPEYSSLYVPLGVAYVEDGDISKAEAALFSSEKAGIDTADSRYLRGVVLFKQNVNERAMAALDDALELEKDFGMAEYYRGQIFDRMGKPDDAIASYLRTSQIEPTFIPAQFDLGVAYYNRGDYVKAASAYEAVIAAAPDNAQAHANLASTYRQLERFHDANREYEAASTEIRTADMYNEWGYSLGRTREWDSAAARLETAAEIAPDAIDNSNVGWAYYNGAQADAEAKNETASKEKLNKAKLFLNKAIEIDAKLDAAHLNLGSTHNSLGEFAEAVRVLNIALGLRGDWVIALNQLGVGYRGLKDVTNAVAALKRATDLDKVNVLGLYNLAGAYTDGGNKKEAEKVNARLRKIDPALASRVDALIKGRVVDEVKKKVPVPRLPRFP